LAKAKPISKIYIALGLILSVVIIGTVGYIIVAGYNFVDAFYMTIITVGTVGFEEVHPLSVTGKLFTAFLIIISLSIFAYALSTMTSTIVSGEINRYFKLRRVDTAIAKLEKHVVICGFGRNGRQAAARLKARGFHFVVIEKNEPALTRLKDENLLYVEGDATLDETLEKANIKKASAIICALPADADNLFIVLSARAMNPKLTIISRASDDNSDKKLKAAGATNVIMPDKIGGAHMAGLVMRPDVIEFLANILGQGDDAFDIEEVDYSVLPHHFRDKAIKDLKIPENTGGNIIGQKNAEGDYIVNPSGDLVFAAGTKLFVLVNKMQSEKVKKMYKAI